MYCCANWESLSTTTANWDEDVQTVPEQDQVGIIGTVARGGTPVDDSCSSGSDLTEGVDVGHDIVSATLLLLGGDLELVVLDRGMSLHLLNCLIGDGKSKLCRHNPVN